MICWYFLDYSIFIFIIKLKLMEIHFSITTHTHYKEDKMFGIITFLESKEYR